MIKQDRRFTLSREKRAVAGRKAALARWRKPRIPWLDVRCPVHGRTPLRGLPIEKPASGEERAGWCPHCARYHVIAFDEYGHPLSAMPIERRPMPEIDATPDDWPHG